MPNLRLSWLGLPAIEIDGRPLRLEMRKTLALLAYLSCSPQSSARETLAVLFWPEFDQEHSLTNLRRNLFSLSRSLPPGLLETDRDKIGLRREDWLQVDVDEFRALLSAARGHPHPADQATEQICPACLSSLEKAAALYKGDFLEGFNLKDCPEFDEWQLYQRESLRSEYAWAVEKLAAEYQRQGKWEAAIRCARAWVALDRLNEPAQRMLMGLYHRSGQRSLALRQYQSLVDLLQTELGQAPEAETLALYQGLLSAEIPARAEAGPAAHPSTFEGAEALIKTKLFIPPLRVDRVARPQLYQLLDAGAQRSLTLVSAPAGFGKTTLLAGWAAHTGLPVAWFSVDEGDNDPFRFVAYLIAALDSILSADLSEQFQAFTQSLQPSVQPTLIQLINHLAGEREPLVLILDDYQFIHSQAVHQVLAFLLERIPACLHLILVTRSDPPISLARLRGRDQLVEVRMSDLRFSLAESDGFLKQVMALHLSDEDVTALEACTEGWIAGLQMAALAIRTVSSQVDRYANSPEGGQAISQFIQAFSGSNRYILDYLGEEVLSRRPEQTHRFLLETSILGRFSGPLCDAVTKTEGSQSVIQELEKENLFLVPLDNERRWYRYHHLFAELLRYRLEESLLKRSGPEREGLPSLEELHLRAADWLEQNQLFGEAVQHFIAAKKYDQAAALIEIQSKPMLFNKGQSYTLREWLAALPEEMYRSRPRLNLDKAWTLILQNQFAAAFDQLELARQAAQDLPEVEAGSVFGEIALIRGALAELRTRDVDAMRTQGLLAWEKLPREDSMLRSLAAWLLGASYSFDGDTRQAEYYLSQSVQLSREARNVFVTSVATLDLSLVRIEQGRFREAYHLLLQTLRELSSGGRSSHPSLIYLYYGLGQILLSWNQLEEAERQLRLGIDVMAQDVPGEMLIMTASILPHVKLAQGEQDEALRLAQECLQRVEAYPLPYIPAMVKANLIRFWMRVGDQGRVEEWLSACGLTPADPIRCIREAEYVALAKALLWQGRVEEASKVLAQMHDLAAIQGRNGRLFYILALQAVALKQSGDLDRALNALESSLKLAQPEGYIRSYVEEGEAMQALLQLGAARGVWQRSLLEGYVARLLEAIRQDQECLKEAAS